MKAQICIVQHDIFLRTARQLWSAEAFGPNVACIRNVMPTVQHALAKKHLARFEAAESHAALLASYDNSTEASAISSAYACSSWNALLGTDTGANCIPDRAQEPSWPS